ncbi:MAG: hypothetical protein ACYC3S_04720 [Chloroflexota bacterium]
MAEPTRLNLHGALAGRHVLVDMTKLGNGDIASLKGANVGAVAAALSAVLVGGDLAHGVDEEGLKQLSLTEMAALIQDVTALGAARGGDRPGRGRRRRA